MRFKFGMKNKKTAFIASVATLASGTAAAQVIQVAILPLLTRVYDADSFGLLGVFTVIVQIIAVVAGLRYEVAFTVNTFRNAENYIRDLCLILTLSISTLSLFVLYVSILLNVTHLPGPFALIAALGIYFTARMNQNTLQLIGRKEFDTVAKSVFLRVLITCIAQLLFGFTDLANDYGLILGTTLGALATLAYTNNAIGNNRFKWNINNKRIRYILSKYANYPKFVVPETLANQSNSFLPIALIFWLYGAEIAGFYFLAYKVISLPMILIATAVRQVLMSELSKLTLEDRIAKFYMVSKYLVFLGALFAAAAFFAGKYLFGFIFGDQWVISGIIVMTLTPSLLAKFVTSPLTASLIVLGGEKKSFILQITLLIFSILSIILPGLGMQPIEMTMLVHSLVLTIIYTSIYFVVRHHVVTYRRSKRSA